MVDLKLPKQAFVNKYIPKTKFYEKTNPGSRLQREFIDKIRRITWKYKLAEDTIGITQTPNVTEIQIFELELKIREIPERVLKVIDKAIPYQILYHFIYNDSHAWGIALKQGKKAENYYFSQWDEPVGFDFMGIDLERVYEKLVTAFIKADISKKDQFRTLIATDAKRKQLEKEIQSLERKINQEKQFNRKVELNRLMLKKKQELKKIEEELN